MLKSAERNGARHQHKQGGAKPKPSSFSSAVVIEKQEGEFSHPDARHGTSSWPGSRKEHKPKPTAVGTTGGRSTTSRTFVDASRGQPEKTKHAGGATVSLTESTPGEKKHQRLSREKPPVETESTVPVRLLSGGKPRGRERSRRPRHEKKRPVDRVARSTGCDEADLKRDVLSVVGAG